MAHRAETGTGLVWLGYVLALAVLAVGLVAPNAARAQIDSDRYAALAIDAVTGEVFYERHADRVLHPASLTKMMTLYMTFRALERGDLTLNQPLHVSQHADNQQPSHLALDAGSTIRVEDAIYALVTKSANDAAVVLAEAIGGTESEFARMMTQQARQLGMEDTVFRNASGLPDSRQVSTAQDMARLAQALIYHYPQYYSYFATERWTYRGTTYRNHNRLLGDYEGVDGLKTGYINASGYNLVASAVRGELRVIAVMFGGASSSERNGHVRDMLDIAFQSERGQYLIAHGSLPFTPSYPERRPWSEIVVADSGPLIMRLATPPEMAGVPVPLRRPGDSPAAQPVAVASSQASPVPVYEDEPLEALLASLEEGAGGSDAPNDIVLMPGVWSIQIGAFSSTADSQRAMDDARRLAPTVLGSAQPQLLQVTTDQGPLYRARFTGLDSTTAMTACTRLAGAGAHCIPIAPEATF
jgi:D-alanyl-D-alanine carboxypeptidase